VKNEMEEFTLLHEIQALIKHMRLDLSVEKLGPSECVGALSARTRLGPT